LLSRRLWCVVASLAVSGGLAVAQSNQPGSPVIEEPTSWLDAIWSLPVFRWFSAPEVTWLPQAPGETTAAVEPPPPPPCSVEPVPAIMDPDALTFEGMVGVGGPVVSVDGLTPGTSRALNRFQELVTKAGGEMYLTSAFRPEAYQQHLRDVWYKWMDELRDNTDPACETLKAQVGDEFTRHQLLPTQHPVPVSDHTLGIGFDAAVQLPVFATRARRRRVSLDRLARLAGMMRPDIRRDPVHFRLIGGRG
jgi:hypothetical protein